MVYLCSLFYTGAFGVFPCHISRWRRLQSCGWFMGCVFPSSFGEFGKQQSCSLPAQLTWAQAVSWSCFPPPVCDVSAFCISSLLWTQELPLHKYWVKTRDGWKHTVALNWGTPWCVPLHELFWDLASAGKCLKAALELGHPTSPLLHPGHVGHTTPQQEECDPWLQLSVAGASPPVAAAALFAKFTLVRALGKPGVKHYRKSLGHHWLLALPPGLSPLHSVFLSWCWDSEVAQSWINNADGLIVACRLSCWLESYGVFPAHRNPSFQHPCFV